MGLLTDIFCNALDSIDKLHLSKEDRNYNDGVDLLAKGEYSKAYDKLVVAAEMGYDRAFEDLWQIFKGGDDEWKKNVAMFFIQLANSGNYKHLDKLWQIYLYTDSVDDKQVVAASLIEAVKNENAESLIYVGQMFLDGIIYEQDIQKAEELFSIAAEAGEMLAYYYMGMMVLNGYYKDKPISEGIQLIQKAADAGIGDALVRIGEMYLKGIHLPLDYLRARQFIQEAAKTGNAEAMKMYHANSQKLYSVTAEPRVRYDSDTQDTNDDESMTEISASIDDSKESKHPPNRWPSNSKKCATCEYWGGQREMTSNRRIVLIPIDKNYRATGKCMHKTWMYTNSIKSHSTGCNLFSKWTLLN